MQNNKHEGLEVTAPTVEEAIAKGLAALGLSHNETEIKILDEGECGLFGLMGAKPARVLLQPKTKSV